MILYFYWFADIVWPSYRSYFPPSEGSIPGHWHVRLLSAICYHLVELWHYLYKSLFGIGPVSLVLCEVCSVCLG